MKRRPNLTLLLTMALLAGCSSNGSSTLAPHDPPAPSTTGIVILTVSTPPTSTTTSAPPEPVQFTPTTRAVGTTFLSYEGEVPIDTKVLDHTCRAAAIGRCDGVWIVTDRDGTSLWLGAQDTGSVEQRIIAAYTVTPNTAGGSLHFASHASTANDNDAPVIVLVRGPSDAVVPLDRHRGCMDRPIRQRGPFTHTGHRLRRLRRVRQLPRAPRRQTTRRMSLRARRAPNRPRIRQGAHPWLA